MADWITTNFVIHESKCTNNCVFCSSRDFGDIRNNIELELQKIEAIKRNGKLIRKIEITGNDPGEYSKLPEVVDRIKSSCPYSIIILSTNGKTLSDDKFLSELISCGITEYRIPIYGHISSIHDKVTQCNGSFDQTIAGINNLLIHSQSVTILTLITRINQAFLNKLFRFLAHFGNSFSVGVPCFSPGQAGDFLPDFDSLKGNLTMAILEGIEENCLPIIDSLPYCVDKYEYNVRSWSKIPYKGYNHWNNEKLLNSGYVRMQSNEIVPAYRVVTKGEQCKGCYYWSKCNGFYKTYVEGGVFKFTPTVGALPDIIEAYGDRILLNITEEI